MPLDKIIVKGARVNNLKNIDVEIPKNKLVVMTGVSGSGKSSLAFDTIYAEGQRRYVESLSAYARMFLDNADKPDVDSIEGLSPSISIDQKTTSKNPRSTVGTVTEIYDYLRLLYARIGRPTCPVHNIEISSQTYEEMVDKIYTYEEDSRIIILSPIAEEKKGTFEKTLEILRKDGYSKVYIDNEEYELDEDISLDKNKKHNILVVIDRIKLKPESRSRIYESIENGCTLSGGKIFVDINGERQLFSEHYSCPYCDFTIPKLEPTMFSFNSPLGACPKCHGIGALFKLDINELIPDRTISIADGGIRYLKNMVFTEDIEWQLYKRLFDFYKIDIYKPICELTDSELDIILHGSLEAISYQINSSGGLSYKKTAVIEGVADLIERRYFETKSSFMKDYYSSYMKEITCETCLGKRLNDKILSVRIGKLNIHEYTEKSISDALDFINNLQLTPTEEKIGRLVFKEISTRLTFLKNVGLHYLTLNRQAGSLSGGEAQRIRLATQIGSHLTGVLYVLDEPSIGLHESDNQKLINSLKEMRDLGNTLIVVEHDEEIMKQADYIIDVGKYAGVHGGKIVAAGTIDEIKKCDDSITGNYLSGKLKIEVPQTRRPKTSDVLKIINASEHNLKNIDVEFPLHQLILVTGVSGSGKSTLVNDILFASLSNYVNRSKLDVGKFDRLEGIEKVNKIINIDQSPIGRTPRSNPATYTGVFDQIRDLFAETKEAKIRGYSKSRFTFNVKGGRCERCAGDGVLKISMNFLPDVYVECDSCHGKRYNSETLECKYKDKSIADVLDMTIEDAYKFFDSISTIETKLKTLVDVGLGYMKLGQPATTISGGEAQRVKLASELYKKINGNTIYILDEPTTGLHSYDIQKLLVILNRLVDQGATVIIIEHNLDVIKQADYIIDLGPNGGDEGGRVVATGTPEEVVNVKESLTGLFLKPKLK